MPFDCNAAYLNWRKDWSAEKRIWCCRHYGRGCPSDFDCEATIDQGGAVAEWSKEKKDW